MIRLALVYVAVMLAAGLLLGLALGEGFASLFEIGGLS